jgi:hypothetical protein
MKGTRGAWWENQDQINIEARLFGAVQGVGEGETGGNNYLRGGVGLG